VQGAVFPLKEKKQTAHQPSLNAVGKQYPDVLLQGKTGKFSEGMR
jgi:hypothetical protein